MAETRIKKYILYTAAVIGAIVAVLIFSTNIINEEKISYSQENKIIRIPAVAGTWYDKNPEVLKNTIKKYIDSAEIADIKGDIKALIVPHAGLSYSGSVAGAGFAQINREYKKAIIMATSHARGVSVQGISIPNFTHYKTPLGEIPVSEDAQTLLENNLFTTVPPAHTTHVIEIELPFLKETLDDFEILPLVTGLLDNEQIKETAESLKKYIDNETLIVVSSDLSHYHEYDEATIMDKNCIEAIENQNLEKAAQCEACGIYPIMILLNIARDYGWEAEIVDYKNSGDITGDKTSVVGYSSIIFYEPYKKQLSEDEKKYLLKIAREKLESIYKAEDFEIDKSRLTPLLKKEQGCFATLNKNGALRGCIGHIIPQEQLYKCVIDNIENAALKDKRFNPVSKEEIDDIEIEISALSAPEKFNREKKDLKENLNPGIDGVILINGNKQSTYLPQVWEQIKSADDFLSNLCAKGGMENNCWQKESTKVYTYQAEVFSENN